MVLIPAGYAQLGNNKDRLRRHLMSIKQVPDRLRKTQVERWLSQWHEAELRVAVKAYWIDRYEVTSKQYAEFMSSAGHRAPGHWTGGVIPAGMDDHPVTHVTYEDAQAYAGWAGKQLPTAAQWVRAFRGDNKQLFPWGDEPEMHRANVAENKGNRPFPSTSPVMATPRDVSTFGVYNLVGNVREIVRDRTFLHGKQAVIFKGSDWSNLGSAYGIASDRTYWLGDKMELPRAQKQQYGFRCVREVSD